MYIAEAHRGHAYGSLLLDLAKKDTRTAGFKHLNLSTDHIGYYEKYGFQYIGDGHHPWEETSRIYQIEV
ncbi:GNAT family N-acetyltransferase [Flavobacterium supellecticarium]|uniref:GNAT family N-acetyltransferase n=1 Tax=Flavobacterium supellecticarium TaxID=2565924 RepID=UPI0021CEAA85|nr:GNAT family N-acetyltransferase [Flavobacterium supellecticarium]